MSDKQDNSVRQNIYITIAIVVLLFAPSVFAGPGAPASWRDSSGALTTTKDVGINIATPLYPLDVRGDVFLPQQALSIDCDGTATTGKGTCAAIADGATLVPLLTSNVDIDGGGDADPNWLCVDSYNTPTIVAEALTTDCEFGIAPAIFTGTGLEDATSGGTFTDTANDTYTIIIDATKGEITTLNATPTAAGSGYTAGDDLTITTGGTYGTANVDTVDGSGGVTAVTLLTAGANYTTGPGKATSGGTGTGCTLDITTVAGGTTDTFKWKKNSGSYTTGVALTGSAQALSDGVTITFATTTGHPKNTQWSITAKTAYFKLLGSIPAGTPMTTYNRIDRAFSFVDLSPDGRFNAGEDLYFGAAPINRYSSTSSVIHGAVVVDGAVIIGGTSGAGGLLNNTAVYTSDGTVRSPAKIVQGQAALSSGSATVTLSGAAVFTGTTTYSVTASRSDSVAYTHSLRIINSSGSQFTIMSSTGSDSDTIAWIAAGY